MAAFSGRAETGQRPHALDASGERARLSGQLPRMSERFPGCHGIAVAPTSSAWSSAGSPSARRSPSTSSSSTRSTGRPTRSSCGNSMSRRSSGFRRSPPRPGGSRAESRLGGKHAQSVPASRLRPERRERRREGGKPSGRPRGAREHRLAARRSAGRLAGAPRRCRVYRRSSTLLCAAGREREVESADGARVGRLGCTVGGPVRHRPRSPTAVIGSGRARAGCG